MRDEYQHLSRAQRHHVVRGQRLKIIRPLLQPYPCLGVIAMPIIDGAYRTIDVIEDAVLHHARAAELRQSRGHRATQVVNRPRQFNRIGARLALLLLACLVLRKAERFRTSPVRHR